MNLTDHDPGSLRDAIAITPSGETVDFQKGLSGTISLTTGELQIARDLTIAGPGADMITISGNHTGGVLRVYGGFIQIGGLTIADGYTPGFGGGIANSGTLTVASSILRDNFSIRGGRIENAGTLTVVNSILSNNSAVLVGGGIYNANPGTATVINSTFTGNGASGGGGIANEGGTLTVTASTLSGNFGADGAGITNGGRLAVIMNSTLSGNIVSARGGFGAALSIYAGAQTIIANSTLSANSVTASDGFGGGLAIVGVGTQTLIRNTIIAGNNAASAPDMHGQVNSQGHNLIGDGTGGSGYTDTDLVGTAQNPINPMLGRLEDNGGPTWTHALLSGSPALNAGDPDELGNPDQRGVLRSGGVNIGAYQASASAFVLTAPDTVTAGVPFDLIVTAVDVFAQTAVGYTGTVTFSTSDPNPDIVLPADYAFTAEDGGVHTFTDTGLGEITLLTPGEQTVTATDAADDTITGYATITVGSPNTRLLGLLAPGQPSEANVAPATAPTRSASSGPEVVAVDRLFASPDAEHAGFLWHRLSQKGQGAGTGARGPSLPASPTA
jgi:hypothetical protein